MNEIPSASDEHLFILDNFESFSHHALKILTQARRNVNILSNDLDAQLYNNAKISEVLSRLARNDRNAEVRILVKDIRPIIESNHAVLQLARRLPSKIKIRRLLIEPENDDRAYLVADRDVLLYKHDDREFSGFANYRAGPEVRKVMEEFDYLWQRQCADDVNLRSLTL